MHKLKGLRLHLSTLAMIFCGALVLSANGNADREFLKNSRAELKRLEEISQQKNITESPAKTFNPAFKNTFILPKPGRHPVQRRTQKTEEEKSAENQEQNWLLTGMEKLSGIKNLTEEEKKRLLDPHSGLRLVDRYVLEQEMTGIRKETPGNRGGNDYIESDVNSIFDFNYLNPLSDLGDLNIQNRHRSLHNQNNMRLISPLDDLTQIISTFEGGAGYHNPFITQNNTVFQMQQFGELPVNSNIEAPLQGVNPYLNNQEFSMPASTKLSSGNSVTTPSNYDINPDSFKKLNDNSIDPADSNAAKNRTYQPPEDKLKKYLPQLDSF